MKKMILMSLLAISAGQLFGASNDDSALDNLLTAIGNLDKDRVEQIVNKNPNLINADDGTFSPLGIASNLARTGGDLGEDKVKIAAQEIKNFLKRKGASKNIDNSKNYRWYVDKFMEYNDKMSLAEAINKFTDEYVPKDKSGKPVENFQEFIVRQPGSPSKK